MPDQQDDEKTPFSSISEPDHKIVLALRRWLSFNWNQRVDVVLILAFRFFASFAVGYAVVWFVRTSIYSSPRLFAGAVGGALCTLFLLLWRARRTKTGTTRKILARRLRYLIVAIVIATVCVGVAAVARYRKASGFHRELKNSGLPADLYDVQLQLKSLTIQQGALTDLDWLDTTALTDLTIASGGLRSLHGLGRIPNLHSLDLDLTDVPLESLADISSLHHLDSLVLRNIGRAKKPLVPEIRALPQLTKLDLDFARSAITSLPDLTAGRQLKALTLDLRSTSILQLPDLSGLPDLSSVSIFLDNSKVRNLKPLANLSVHTLVLSLDGTQVEMLSDLKSGLGPHLLDVTLTSPPTSALPDLSGISNLDILALRMPGARGSTLPDKTPIPDITYLGNKLHALTICAKGSEIRELPAIGRLTDLVNLNLDLEMSSLQKFPDISGLHDLQHLTVNVGSTAITELPDFSQFPKLHELNLFLANSQIHSLHGIQSLKELRTVTLDITGTKLSDIDSIAQIGNLEKLVLWLRWGQVGALPDLSPLANLKTLELHIDNWWNSEELPDLSNLAKLTSVRLVLPDSDTNDLSRLAKVSKMERLYLDLKDSSITILPDLRLLNKLDAVGVDIRHSKITLNDALRLNALEELTIDKNVSSLENLPQSVTRLVIGPCSEKDKQCTK